MEGASRGFIDGVTNTVIQIMGSSLPPHDKKRLLIEILDNPDMAVYKPEKSSVFASAGSFGATTTQNEELKRENDALRRGLDIATTRCLKLKRRLRLMGGLDEEDDRVASEFYSSGI